MKKLLFILSTLLISSTLFAQDYKIDGDNIVVSKLVEGIDGSKEEIYKRVKSYFTRSYINANSVIQTDDREGGLIIGKGLYPKVGSHSFGAWIMKAYHILRIDIKDGRARIICSASTIIPNSSSYPGNDYEYKIVDHAPITNKKATGATKGSQKKALANLVLLMHSSVDSLEKAMIEGGTLNSEQDEW